MDRALVAYFSRTGRTRRIALEIAETCAARPVATLAITEHEINTGNYGDELARFIERISVASMG